MKTLLLKLVAMVRLIHAFPSAAVVVTSALLLVVVHRGSLAPEFLLRATGTVLLSQASVGALNDYLDRSADARLQPDKPIPSGLVSPAAALVLTVVSLVLIVPAALSFGPLSVLFVAIGTGAGLAYDLWLKPTPLSFICYIVAFLSLLTWIWLIAGKFSVWLLPVYPAAALLLVAAHLAQSFPDIESDRAEGLRGLAVVLGPYRTPRAVVTLYGIAGAGALGLVLLARSLAGLALVSASLFMMFPAWRLGVGTEADRASRTRMFHIIATGICLQGLGSLMSVVALG